MLGCPVVNLEPSYFSKWGYKQGSTSQILAEKMASRLFIGSQKVNGQVK